MHLLALTLFSAWASSVVARQCHNITVPVNISARNAVFDLPIPQNDLELAVFALNQTRQGGNLTADVLTGYNTVSGSYNISAKFCRPDNVTSKPFVQVLTHGIGFDKTYWDIPYNNYNYSYINSALAEGYCTLSYDRLGLGNSSHGEPLNEIQVNLEIASLRAITTMLREGTFPQVNYTFENRISHVGHSFGSAQTYAFASLYPNETSGIILTGFSRNSSYTNLLLVGANVANANTNQPLRFGNVNGSTVQQYINMSPFADFVQGINFAGLPRGQNLPNGYLVQNDIEAALVFFFFPNHYDPGILYYAEQTKQPVTLGELLTNGGGPMMSDYAGPVLIITGEYDIPFCGGNCTATGGVASSIVAQSVVAFPKVDPSNFTTYLQPDSGHGINLHYNATGAYAVIQDFLKSRNLKSA